MKPRQWRAPLTEEDWWIWSTRLTKDLTDDRGLYDTLSQDRRDADLMLELSEYNERGYAVWLRIDAENVQVPGVHVLVRKNPLWPDRQ